MPPPNRASLAENWTIEELVTILFRQFKRPLQQQGVNLSDAEAAHIAENVANRAELPQQAQAVRDALKVLITESEGVLAQWNLSFEQSLDAAMTDIPGWESTSDFLEIANEKANAELRIGLGAALAMVLGETGYAGYLQHLAQGDYDLDSVIARRVLEFMKG